MLPIIVFTICLALLPLPAQTEDCGKVLVDGEGIVLGTGLNQTIIKRVQEQGRTFLVIEDFGPDGRPRRQVDLIKPGSPAATQKFGPEGMRD